MNQPIHDYTGRSEGGVASRASGASLASAYPPIDPYNNDFTRMQEESNTQALYDLMGKVFPVHPALGGQVQELARMIMDSASGQGTQTSKEREWFTGKSDPTKLDRVGGLIGKWTGNAVDDIGQALGMTAEDLMSTARTVKDLGNDPQAQLELLQGIGQSLKAKYGGDDGPLAALEDFGAPGGAFLATGPRRVIGNLLGGEVGSKQIGMPDRVDAPEFSDALGGLGKEVPRKDMPLPDWEGGSDTEFAKFLDHDESINPGGYQTYVDPDFTKKLDGLADENLEDLIDALSLKKWDKKGQTVSDHDTNLKHLAMAEDELRKRQEPLHQKAMDELEGMEGDLADAGPSLQTMTDDALDADIQFTNNYLNSGFGTENLNPSVLESYKEHLQNLVKERRRRRKAKGGSGEAYGYSLEKSGEDITDPYEKFDDFEEMEKSFDLQGLSDKALVDKTNKTHQELKDLEKTDIFSMNEAQLKTHKNKNAELLDLLDERRRRREAKGGGGGSAGAQKAQGSIEQMTQQSGKVPADLPDMKGGAIGKLAYNIENFHAGADIGNVPRILENAKFVSKRNMWHFPVDPDVGVFDLNGFFARMAHPKHELNADEITVLARVLDQAKAYPSRRNLSSMAEDLYKTMVSGPAKSGLEGIGFNIQ